MELTQNLTQLTKSFDIDCNVLKDILYKTGGFIAGSSCLSLLVNNGIPFEDADLDIFIKLPYEKKDNIDYKIDINKYKTMCPFEMTTHYYITDVLNKQDYYEDSEYESSKYTKTYTKSDEITYKSHHIKMSNYIKNVTQYVNKKNKRIQIIFIYNHPIKKFLYTFDLNICALAYTYDTIDSDFKLITTNNQTDYENIFNKIMYIQCKSNYNSLNRIIKYTKRGFKLVLSIY